MSSNVKYFHSGQLGMSPTYWSNPAAALAPESFTHWQGVLDAVLVNGFNTQNVLTATVSNGVVTFSYAAPHGYEEDTVILVSGSDAAVNGERRVLSVPTSSSLTFALPGVSAPVFGSPITKVAPVGLAKTYSTSSLAVYQFPDVDGTRCAFALQGVNYTSFSITLYRGVSATTGEGVNVRGVVNTDLSVNTNSGFTQQWVIVADGRTIYVSTSCFGGTYRSMLLSGVGDFQPIGAYDPYAAFARGARYNGASGDEDLSYLTNSTRSRLLLSGSLGGSSPLSTQDNIESFFSVNGGAGVVGLNSALTYPNQGLNSLILSRRYISDNGGLRGYYRGLYQTTQNVSGQAHMTKITGTGAMTGKKLLVVDGGSAGTSALYGKTFFDITGPWS